MSEAWVAPCECMYIAIRDGSKLIASPVGELAASRA